MKDKLREIESKSQKMLQAVQEVVQLEPEELIGAMRRCMDTQQLRMFDLALLCEQETIKAQSAGAHLAACLMGAAMNEALSALMCLKYEPEVSATKQFAYSNRKKPRPFRELISSWHFEQFISVAEECNWIPSQIVDDEIKEALAEGFKELMPISHPEMSESDIARGAETFFTYPGTAMLRMTQTLRNAIHAGRWMKSDSPLVAEHFMQWCRLATHLCGEIRLCLLKLIAERDSKIVREQLQQLNSKLEKLPPEFRNLFERQVKAALQAGGLSGDPHNNKQS
jgi:hypothetical protein